MKFVVVFSLVFFAIGSEPVITKSYLEDLKSRVDWEVVDYEDSPFRGWTIDELKSLLSPSDVDPFDIPIKAADVEVKDIDWSKESDCIHSVRSQGNCAASWAFSVAGMISDQCCMKKGKDYGWLSSQELVSCDMTNNGCGGGYVKNAIEYVIRKGLVTEECFPYFGEKLHCPTRCANGREWEDSHLCKCKNLISCKGHEEMYRCINDGPISTTLRVYQDFYYYKGGIYEWDRRSSSLGVQSVRCYGRSSQPRPHWLCINSWGTNWGEQGYFKIATGECGIETIEPAYCVPQD